MFCLRRYGANFNISKLGTTFR